MRLKMRLYAIAAALLVVVSLVCAKPTPTTDDQIVTEEQLHKLRLLSQLLAKANEHRAKSFELVEPGVTLTDDSGSNDDDETNDWMFLAWSLGEAGPKYLDLTPPSEADLDQLKSSSPSDEPGLLGQPDSEKRSYLDRLGYGFLPDKRAYIDRLGSGFLPDKRSYLDRLGYGFLPDKRGYLDRLGYGFLPDKRSYLDRLGYGFLPDKRGSNSDM